jgi:hypothetical protein
MARDLDQPQYEMLSPGYYHDLSYIRGGKERSVSTKHAGKPHYCRDLQFQTEPDSLFINTTGSRSFYNSTHMSSGSANGSVNQNVDPAPFVLSTPTSPWCCSMIARQIFNPKPKPTLEPLCLFIPSTW